MDTTKGNGTQAEVFAVTKERIQECTFGRHSIANLVGKRGIDR
jgi:hypothetical protein